MSLFRKIIFWTHFVVGVSLGSVIGIMAVSGVILSFREQIVARAEKSVRLVEVSGAPLRLREILEEVRDARPGANPSMLTVNRDPKAAVQVMVGRGDVVFVNPYTGDVRETTHTGLRKFFETTEHVHRWLGLSGKGQQVGLVVTIASCGGFILLLVSGIYLWWPRNGTWRAFRQAARVRFDQSGKARDWNWHTTVGFWLSPLIILSASTGMIMGAPRLGEIVFGVPRQEGGFAPAAQVRPALPGARPLGFDALLQKVEAAYPAWDTITLRLGAGRQPRAAGENRPSADAQAKAPRQRQRGPVSFSVKERGRWPALLKQVTLDPNTGEVLSAQDASKMPLWRMLRSSARWFHVGEAFGVVGQALVMIGALGAFVLVVTGFCLAWRRLFARA